MVRTLSQKMIFQDFSCTHVDFPRHRSSLFPWLYGLCRLAQHGLEKDKKWTKENKLIPSDQNRTRCNGYSPEDQYNTINL